MIYKTRRNRQYNDQKKQNKWTNNDIQNWEKHRQYNDQKKQNKRTNNDIQNWEKQTIRRLEEKKINEQTMIYKTLHRKLQIDQHESH